MAKDTSGNPWIFDTAGEKEGQEDFSVTDDNFDVQIYVKTMLLVNPAGANNTTFEVLEGDSTDSSITGALVVAAGAHYQLDVNGYVDGIYIATLPTGGKVYVYHGEPD